MGSSIDKERERINNNESINYDRNNEMKDPDNDIYKQNKNITTPELGSKFNNKFAKNITNKYDKDNDENDEFFLFFSFPKYTKFIKKIMKLMAKKSNKK